MRKMRRKHVSLAMLAALVGALAFAAAGCGGGGGGSASSEIKGLGTSLADIQSKAKDEGQVNLVIWPGYADKSWAKPVHASRPAAR